uniref:Uncharacterized protein n=1 Tax=Aquilaria malaccensis TaxID=223753 RepID=A0A4Y6GNX1_9ROSI|nr:hypothetical protein [Aquilaria malaccensis]
MLVYFHPQGLGCSTFIPNMIKMFYFYTYSDGNCYCGRKYATTTQTHRENCSFRL